NASVEVSLIDPAAAPTITGTSDICDGTTVELSSSEATGNVWSTGATTQTINVDDAGTYSVSRTGSNGCVATSDPFTVNVVSPANAGEDNPLSVCEGSVPVSLFSSILGTPEPGGEWSGPSLVIDELYDPSTMDAGTYMYMISGTTPCENDTAFITVEEFASAD